MVKFNCHENSTSRHNYENSLNALLKPRSSKSDEPSETQNKIFAPSHTLPKKFEVRLQTITFLIFVCKM